VVGEHGAQVDQGVLRVALSHQRVGVGVFLTLCRFEPGEELLGFFAQLVDVQGARG
jgi:hypothetical protein